MSQVKLHRLTEAQVDILMEDDDHPWGRWLQALMSQAEGGYVVVIDGEAIGAVWRDPSVTATYWGAWRGTGRVRAENRRDAVRHVVDIATQAVAS